MIKTENEKKAVHALFSILFFNVFMAVIAGKIPLWLGIALWPYGLPLYLLLCYVIALAPAEIWRNYFCGYKPWSTLWMYTLYQRWRMEKA